MRLTQILRSYEKLPKRYSNYPDRYVAKQTEFVEWKTPNLPNYQRRTVRWRRRPYYDMFRPWTDEFQQQNAPNVKQPMIYVEPIRDFFVFRGDRVQLLRGRDRGKQGIVNYVVKERNWVTVEGLNCEYKLERRSAEFAGRMIAVEKPLLVPRDVSLVDPSDFQPTDIEWRLDEDGNRVRVSRRTARIIPLPSAALETADFQQPAIYLEQAKDTTANNVKHITFTPKVKTFEMDVMDQMGIKEDRVPYNMYWY